MLRPKISKSHATNPTLLDMLKLMSILFEIFFSNLWMKNFLMLCCFFVSISVVNLVHFLSIECDLNRYVYERVFVVSQWWASTSQKKKTKKIQLVLRICVLRWQYVYTENLLLRISNTHRTPDINQMFDKQKVWEKREMLLFVCDSTTKTKTQRSYWSCCASVTCVHFPIIFFSSFFSFCLAYSNEKCPRH